MHLCDGTLNEWLRNRNLKDTFVDISNASCIMLKATKGVQYIHSCNIVHHDIKVGILISRINVINLHTSIVHHNTFFLT